MRSPARPGRLALLATVALGVLAGGVYLVRETLDDLAAMPCTADDTHSGWRIVALAGGAFVLGHLAGYARLDGAALLAQPARPARTAVFTHAVLLVFFLALTFILVYEAVSLWNPPGGAGSPNPWGLQPITDYVRCARSVAPWRASIIVTVISFFVGHWLWPPRRRGRTTRAAGALGEAG